MLGPFATASRLTPIHQGSLAVLSRAACASMSTTSTTTTTTTPTTTTTTTRDRGDRYGSMEWAQLTQAKYIALLASLPSGLNYEDAANDAFLVQQMRHSKREMRYMICKIAIEESRCWRPSVVLPALRLAADMLYVTHLVLSINSLDISKE